MVLDIIMPSSPVKHVHCHSPQPNCTAVWCRNVPALMLWIWGLGSPVLASQPKHKVDLHQKWAWMQGLTKVVSDGLGIADFAVGQADFSSHLTNGQAWLQFFMACSTVDWTSGQFKIASGKENWSTSCQKAELRFWFLLGPVDDRIVLYAKRLLYIVDLYFCAFW